MPAIYNHTNIVSHDPDRLAAFYIDVFDCVPQGPERNLQGAWIERGTGVPGVRIRGVHLRLPGHGDTGPTLEIFRVEGSDHSPPKSVAQPGLMHLCFTVEDVRDSLDRVLAAGGSRQGEIVTTDPIKGVGVADFVYARDPDGNIVELVAWRHREEGAAAS